jgi:hypothetical protein
MWYSLIFNRLDLALSYVGIKVIGVEKNQLLFVKTLISTL